MSKIIVDASLFDKADVGSNTECKQLLDQITTVRTTPSTDYTNVGCWRSTHKYSNIDWLMLQVLDLVKTARTYYDQLDQVFAGHPRDNIKIEYWTNVNSPGSRNILHSHKNSHFSCVYYLQGTDTGDLRLINPANMLGDCNISAPFVRDFYFSPKDRDLILWPSWIPHEVEPNHSARERINIVFDITLT
jgi:uncharacterized protein (TIGR02466 family)